MLGGRYIICHSFLHDGSLFLANNSRNRRPDWLVKYYPSSFFAISRP
jgi:hypothetical protein